jgi:hypothetical protein
MRATRARVETKRPVSDRRSLVAQPMYAALISFNPLRIASSLGTTPP